MTTVDNGDEPVRLGDRYEIGEFLGRGGMADVRQGRDLRLGRTVAIKQLRSDLASDPVFLERFRREAQSAAALNHPSIVAVYDTGEAASADGTTIPYIIMEYVEGHTLRDLMRDGRRILPERALEIVAEILSALDYSHRAGIVHRDIKPANVMLTPEGKVKVMDFGIARAIADSSSAMTQTAAVIGTAQYLSPEQARGETVDARSDIYSTGCVLYELLAGRPPFVGDSPVSVAYQHVREEAQPPSQLNSDVGASIDAIVAKALTKRTDDRYQSAADMRTDVESFLAGHEVSGASTQAMAATQAVPATEDEEEEEEDDSRRKKIWAAVIGVLLLLALIFGLWWFLSGDEEPVATAEVPDVTGMSAEEATTTLEAEDFVVETETAPSNEDDEGNVVDQDPSGGEEVEVGSTVTLTVGAGPEPVSVPDVTGLDYDDAAEQLSAAGLTPDRDDVDEGQTAGQVLRTNPSAGQEVEPGSTVTVTVSRGTTEIPNVVGASEDEATSDLESAGFEVRVVYETTDSTPEGQVIRQDPSSGERRGPGSTVTIFVAEAPEDTDGDDDQDADQDADQDGDQDGDGGGLLSSR